MSETPASQRGMAPASQRGMGSRAVRTLSSLETMTDKQVAWSTNFYIYSLAYAMSFGAALTSFDMQNYILAGKVERIGTGILMTIIVVASIPAGTITNSLGPKKTQMLATLLMLVYFVGLALAAFMGQDSLLQWPFYIIGAVGCGLSVALLGAAQGPWVDRTADILCKEDPELDRSEVSSHLLANFAVIGAVSDIVCMLLFAGLKSLLKLPYHSIIAIYCGVALLALLFSSVVRDPPATTGGKQQSIKEYVQITCNYYKELRALLLIFAPITIGIFSAWKTFDIGNILLKPGSIGDDYAPIVNLIQQLTKLAFAKLFESAIPCCGTNPIMWLGTFGFITSGLLALLTDVAYQGWGVLTFYVLGGASWAVVGTAFNVVLLYHFKDEQASTAFAASNMQQFIGQAVFFFMGETYVVKAVCIIAFALPIMPALYLADWRKQKQEGGRTGKGDKGEKEDTNDDDDSAANV